MVDLFDAAFSVDLGLEEGLRTNDSRCEKTLLLLADAVEERGVILFAVPPGRG